MKKLILFLAVAGLSLLASAGSFRWTNAQSGLSTPGGATNDSSLNGLTIYLIDASMQADIIAAIDGGTFTADTTGVLGSAKTTSNKGYINKATTDAGDAYEVGKSYSLAELVFMTDADNNQVYRISKAFDQVAWNSTTDVAAYANFTGTSWANGSSWTSPQGSGTPEPTSGLLLLVGGAMLALRRKQK